jgi:hypothetical protein
MKIKRVVDSVKYDAPMYARIGVLASHTIYRVEGEKDGEVGVFAIPEELDPVGRHVPDGESYELNAKQISRLPAEEKAEKHSKKKHKEEDETKTDRTGEFPAGQGR